MTFKIYNSKRGQLWKLVNAGSVQVLQVRMFVGTALPFKIGYILFAVAMVTEACYLIPFWVVAVLLLRCFIRTYTAILVVSVLFGGLEIVRPRKSDETAWRKMTKDLTVIGHKGCAMNAPENTLAGKVGAGRMPFLLFVNYVRAFDFFLANLIKPTSTCYRIKFSQTMAICEMVTNET